MKLLFLCSMNMMRSPTAEDVFNGVAGVEAESAGLRRDAELFVTPELIAWADIIFVMEEDHRAKLNKMARSLVKDKRVVCLGIPDHYCRGHPELIDLLWERVPKSVPQLAGMRPDA